MGRVEAPDFSPGNGFFRTRVNRGLHTNPGFSPGPKSVDFIILTIYEIPSTKSAGLHSFEQD
jgi:hypothetical protein